MAARLGLLVLNIGRVTTKKQGIYNHSFFGFGGSILLEDDWPILNDFLGSDHQYISFKVTKDRWHKRDRSAKLAIWRVVKVDVEILPW